MNTSAIFVGIFTFGLSSTSYSCMLQNMAIIRGHMIAKRRENIKVKLRAREFFIKESAPFQVGPFQVDELVAIPGAYHLDISGIQAMLGIHFFCELVSEAFRADEFLDSFTFGVFYQYKWFQSSFHDDSALLAAMLPGVPYLSVHIRFGSFCKDPFSPFFTHLSLVS